MYDYGDCFQFKSGLNYSNQKIYLIKSSRLDKDYGLILQFHFHDSYVLDIGNSTFGFIIHDFVVLVHNSTSIISSCTKLTYIKAKKKLAMYFQRILISKQPFPYSSCIDLSSYSSVLYDYILHLNYSYRQIDCLDLCIQQKIII